MMRFANLKAMLSVTSASIALVGVAPAFAQVVPPSAQGQSTAPAMSDASTTTVPTSGIDDIIVTAQRRSENVQKSSLSIQVLSADAIQRAGATQAGDLITLVPGIQIAAIGSVVQVAIRGVGDTSTNALSTPAVAFNVDGVYVSRSTAIGNNFYDIARIEALKGPQGTLYGRNASGGAINLITNAPKLGVSDGYLELEGGNYAMKRAAGAFNLPVGDTFAVRGAFQIIDRDGFLSDGSSDLKTQAGRLRALWKPSSAVSLALNFDIGHNGGKGEGGVLLPRLAGEDPWLAIQSPSSMARVIAGTPPPLQGPTLVVDGPIRQNNRFINTSAQLDWDLGPATLTIIPAYRHTKEDYDAATGFIFQIRNVSRQASLEARLAHNGEKLKWVLGGYLFDEVQHEDTTAIGSLLAVASERIVQAKTRAYAAFGDATFSITPRFRVLGGLRYTSETPELVGANRDLTVFNNPPEIINGKQRFTATTWKAGTEYDIAPHNLVFATVSTGFKAGGINPEAFIAGTNSVYRPEKLTAYSIGSRNRFLDNRLQINLEAFYWDYKNKQEGSITLSNAGYFDFLRTNAGNATLKGGSIDITVRPTNTDTFHLFAEYNDTKFKTFNLLIPTAFFNPAATGCAFSTGPVLGGLPFTNIDCAGRPLTKAPLWVGTAEYSHRFDLANAATLDATLGAQYSSGYFLGTEFLPAERTTSYALLNASLTYVSPSKAWSVTAYVKNITDHPVYTAGIAAPLQAPLIVGNIGAPRTFGGRVRLTF